MSELKVYKMVDEYYCDDSFCVIPSDVYLKSEADKLIAELNMRICEGDEDFELANNQIERLLKIVRQQKYKRCLAMAEVCKHKRWRADVCDEHGFDYARMTKQMNKWLELAEQFKDAFTK